MKVVLTECHNLFFTHIYFVDFFPKVMDRNLPPDQVDFSLIEKVQLTKVSHQSCAAFVIEIVEEDGVELLALLKCIN